MNPIPDTLVTTYLEMTRREQFRPAFLPPAERMDCRIMELQLPDLDFYRFLYRAVGEAWRWKDRLAISDAGLRRWLQPPRVTVDVLYVSGAPAGYIELDREGADTEVAYFGLREPWFGRGLGKHLLSHGVQRAWDEGARRIWVHTCNLDISHALATYRHRGFVVYRVEEMPMPALYAQD